MMDLVSTPLLLWMLIVHLVADFPLQPLRWVRDKALHRSRSRSLFLHVLVHAMLATGAVIVFDLQHDGFSATDTYATLLTIGISHYFIDLMKMTWLTRLKPADSFLIDQGFHLAVIVGLWLYLIPDTSSLLHAGWQHINGITFCVVLLAYLLIYQPMSILIGQLLAYWAPQMSLNTNADHDSLLRAGKQIGYLERTLILTFVLIDQISAIGFLLAAKSIFRFGDLRQTDDKIRTEYVLLGTLFSFTLTIMLGLLIKALA